MKRLSQFSRRTVLGFAVAMFVAAPAVAAKPIALTPQQVTSINAVSDYLNSFRTLRGEFSQISPKGNLSRGVFFISKPGKMRFEYAPPNPFLIVSDGTWLTIKNTKKETGDQFPLSQTPLRLVLGTKVDIAKDTDILGFDEQDGLTSVTLEDRDASLGSGQLTLVYDQTRKALQQWIVIDGKGRRTTVTLENLETGINNDPKLFVVSIDRKEHEK